MPSRCSTVDTMQRPPYLENEGLKQESVFSSLVKEGADTRDMNDRSEEVQASQESHRCVHVKSVGPDEELRNKGNVLTKEQEKKGAFGRSRTVLMSENEYKEHYDRL